MTMGELRFTGVFIIIILVYWSECLDGMVTPSDLIYVAVRAAHPSVDSCIRCMCPDPQMHVRVLYLCLIRCVYA